MQDIHSLVSGGLRISTTIRIHASIIIPSDVCLSDHAQSLLRSNLFLCTFNSSSIVDLYFNTSAGHKQTLIHVRTMSADCKTAAFGTYSNRHVLEMK